MQSGNILVVNHALFFSDLALRAAGVNYLPKYDAVILDEAHTVEDVAGEHFGLEVSESRHPLPAPPPLRPQARQRHAQHARRPRQRRDPRRRRAARARRAVSSSAASTGNRPIGRANGRVHEANFVENDLSPKLRDLAKHLKAMLTKVDDEEEIAEIGSLADKVAVMGQTLEAVMSHRHGRRGVLDGGRRHARRGRSRCTPRR